MYDVHCTVYILHCAIYTVYTVHCILHIVQCTQCSHRYRYIDLIYITTVLFGTSVSGEYVDTIYDVLRVVIQKYRVQSMGYKVWGTWYKGILYTRYSITRYYILDTVVHDTIY